MKQIITTAELAENEWWSSFDRATHPLFSEILPENFSGTVLDVLALQDITAEDKVYFAIFGAGRRHLGKVADTATLDDFAQWCVEQAEDAARTPNQKTSAARARRCLGHYGDPHERAWNACVDAGWAHASTIFTSEELGWKAFGDKAVSRLLEILP